MSVQLSFPFRVDGTGKIAVATTLQRQIQLRVIGLLGTLQGERLMRLTYGGGMPARVFADDSELLGIESDVVEALRTWEEDIIVENVVVRTLGAPTEATIAIAVHYRLRSTGEIQQETVLVNATSATGWEVT